LVPQFTGKDSGFEDPEDSDLVIDTEAMTIEESLDKLFDFVFPKLSV
ncbi:MAG: adenylyl-sulfate kinase, partial [Opitutales bacterium]|nr:adenylyl-sulfate kinase [Opitutales bacterium]